MTSVAIIPTGTANMASVKAAFRRLGTTPFEVLDPTQVSNADLIVLPGVGTFGASIEAVDRLGLRDPLRARIDDGRPTLAVCVGMQLLAGVSEESRGARGLGVIQSHVGRFDNGTRVPQLGWNRVEPSPRSRFIDPGWGYFANSFRITDAPPGWTASTTEYGQPFVSTLERESVLALQFHPELSGSWGQAILARWMETA